MNIDLLKGKSSVTKVSFQFNCPAHFPNDVPVPYVVQWEKKGRKKTQKYILFCLISHWSMRAVRLFCLVPTGALLKYKEHRLVVLENSVAVIRMRIPGSVPLTNRSESGSGRLKNIRIQIRIRIRNTARKGPNFSSECESAGGSGRNVGGVCNCVCLTEELFSSVHTSLEKGLYTVKNGSRVSRLQPGCHSPDSPWAGIIQL